MLICYTGKHNNPKSNDDEGGIADGFRQLGHEVICVPEAYPEVTRKVKCDLHLFNHLRDVSVYEDIKIPKVFWYFDRVMCDDDTLTRRSTGRQQWIKYATEVVDCGFCTDGDWSMNDTSGKLVWLMQGFNQVLKPAQHTSEQSKTHDILFTGGRFGGRERESFVSEMQSKYGRKFHHVTKGVHGDKLAQLIAGAKIVVAPDSPVSDSYWSNRVYLTLGLGGFLLHPYSRGIEYQFGLDLQCYKSRDDLHELIKYYLNDPDMRESMRFGGHYRVTQQHTYKHRCESMLNILKDRGII